MRTLLIFLLVISSLTADAQFRRTPLSDFPVDMRVAANDIGGAIYVYKFGTTQNFGTADDPLDIWLPGGAYTGHPTADTFYTVKIFSTSAVDSLNGTGANKITIYGLDEDWALASEEITLAGTDTVESTTTFRRVFRGVVTLSGTGQENAGALKCMWSGDLATVFFVISAGYSQTQVAAYTVPAGYTFYVRQFHSTLSRLSGAAASGIQSFLVRPYGTSTWQSKLVESITTSSPLYIDGWLPIPEKSDIKVHIISVSDNNVSVSSQFEGFLIKNRS